MVIRWKNLLRATWKNIALSFLQFHESHDQLISTLNGGKNSLAINNVPIKLQINFLFFRMNFMLQGGGEKHTTSSESWMLKGGKKKKTRII